MIITTEERSQLRLSLERALDTTDLESTEKRLLLTMLALLQDLDEAERNSGFNGIEASLSRVITDLSSGAPNIDAEYIRNFSSMAESLNVLAKKVWTLKEALDAVKMRAMAEQNQQTEALQ